MTKEFTGSWTSHNEQVKAGFELRYNRFLILLLDESHVKAGGCSIDTSIHFIRSVEKEFQVIMTDRMKFAVMMNEAIHVLSKDEFEQSLSDGKLDADSIVFNNLVNTRAELDTQWEIPLKNSWHKNYFSVNA
ncbi:MAG: ABC transporter ATPase [Bacteroidetes bacterium]|nr:ABC transporter ATPase [Bacteroidota bacterium]